jgi:DNA-directed RNA polymerase specialized sigma24 family protein
VVLRYFADQSIEQTALALGKPQGTIRSLTSQGTTRLRKLLEESDES